MIVTVLIHKFICIYLFDRCLKAAILKLFGLRTLVVLRIVEDSEELLLCALYLLIVLVLEIKIEKL